MFRPNHTARARQATAERCRPAADADLQDPAIELRRFERQGESLCLVRERRDLGARVELCDTRPPPASTGPLPLILRSRVGANSFEKRLEPPARVFVSIGADVAIADGVAYFAWVEGTQPDRIRVVALDPAKQAVASDGTFHSQPWGIQQLSMGFARKSGLLHLAWKDISTKSNKGKIVLGTMSVADRGGPAPVLKTREVFAADSWEKSNPAFLAWGDELALTVTTGESFGVLAHRGTRALGVAFVDDERDYRILAAERPLTAISAIGPGRLLVYSGEDGARRAIAFADAHQIR